MKFDVNIFSSIIEFNTQIKWNQPIPKIVIFVFPVDFIPLLFFNMKLNEYVFLRTICFSIIYQWKQSGVFSSPHIPYFTIADPPVLIFTSYTQCIKFRPFSWVYITLAICRPVKNISDISMYLPPVLIWLIWIKIFSIIQNIKQNVIQKLSESMTYSID